MRLSRHLVLCFALVAPAATPLPAQTDSLSVTRLSGLGRLWGEVKYFHPALATRSDLDWDAALVAAIPQVSPRAARRSTCAPFRPCSTCWGTP